MLTADTRVASCFQATVRIQELLQQLDVLVVDVFDVMLREKTIFCHIRKEYLLG